MRHAASIKETVRLRCARARRWDAETDAKFEERAQCMAEQFSAYTVDHGRSAPAPTLVREWTLGGLLFLYIFEDERHPCGLAYMFQD